MPDKNKLSWGTRLKLCWAVLTRGEYDAKEYISQHAQEQWEICERRRKEMELCTRPRTERLQSTDEYLEQ